MIDLYWWNGPPRNFGDALQPFIVEALSGQRVRWAPPEHCDMIAGGSVLQIAEAKAAPGTAVWGAGFIAEGGPWQGAPLDFRAVRGPLTAARLPTQPQAIGDPVSLAPLVFGDQHHHGRHVVAPHYADRRPLGDGERVDLTADPLDLVRAIGGAASVNTSSLHAMVLAMAYGVEAVRYSPCDAVVGGDYKVRDWEAGEDDFDAEAMLAAAPWR